jgi:hypothetical protein
MVSKVSGSERELEQPKRAFSKGPRAVRAIAARYPFASPALAYICRQVSSR